jgi:hypothetical protein
MSKEPRITGVILKEGGLFAQVWHPDAQEYTTRPLEGHEYWYVANESLEVEGEPTFGDLFNAIGKFDIETLLTLGKRNHCDIVSFLEESSKESKEAPDQWCQIAFLRVVRHITFRREGDMTEFESHLDFGGEGTCKDADSETPVWSNIGIGLTPVNELMRYPFRVLNTIPVYLERHSPWKTKELFKTTTSLTLDEVVNCVLWEISFYGSPEDREEMQEELQDRVKEVDSGEVKGIPMEDVFEKLGWERPVDVAYCKNCLTDIGTASSMCSGNCRPENLDT